MIFPNQLKPEHIKFLRNRKISIYHIMYWRCKPGSVWQQNSEVPDFLQIRSDQSFNWSAYSIPLWARFNDKMEFLKDYGIVGFRVSSIVSRPKLFRQKRKAFKINHQPLPTNFSHCELDSNGLTTIEKRNARYFLGNCAIVYLKPDSQPSSCLQKFWKVKMYAHRIFSI